MKASIDKRIVYNNCIHYLDIYINDLIVVQEEVFNVLKEEFKPENVCEPTSSPKYLTVMSKFCSSSASRGDMYKNVILSYPPSDLLLFFWNGDVKSVELFRDFAGEWEMVEMALAFEKMKPPKSTGDDDFITAQLLFTTEIAKNFIDFNRDHKSRPSSAKSILEMTNQLNCDTRTTFHTFESQAFANWICSHLPKVASFRVENLEFLDSYNCLHRAMSKSESVMKNRLPGIQKEFAPLEFRNASSDTLDFVKACASFAESCDLRRDYIIELLNVGMIRDAAANSQLGLWCALKCGVLFRIQQFVNINTLIRSCVVQPDFKNDLRNCLDMMRMIYSSESSLAKDFFGCPKKKLSEVCFADDLTTGKPSSL
ncbi:hypothetical protein OSTOST_08375, partial [Ostertagia ostertagi]